MAISILAFGASGICWGAKGKDSSAVPAPQSAARSRVVQRLQYASGPVRLVLRDHTKVRGRVVKTYSDHLTLQTLEGDEIVKRTIHYTQVKKITYIIPGHPYLQLFAGNVVSSGTLAVIILAAVGAL